MKKLTFYFLVSLFFITNVLADQFLVSDIKLGTKITDYLTTAQISKYNINDAESDTPFYSYDGKYSWIMIHKKENIYKDDYDYAQFFYANKNDEIVTVSAVVDYQFDHSEGLNECIEYRNRKLSEYKRKKLIIRLKQKNRNFTHENGAEEDSVFFQDALNRYTIAFTCFSYLNNDNDFRFEYTDFDYNKWLIDQMKKHYN